MPLKITSVLQYCTQLANAHPYTWFLGWKTVWHLRFLLPHEQGFNALRHFVALRPDGMFLDVGANNGISALSFRKFSKRYKILSIEPNPLLEPYLKRIKAEDAGFDYLISGAGSTPGRIKFFVPTYGGIVLHTATSAQKQQVYDAIAHWFSPSIAAKTKVEPFESPIVRLDDLDLQPSIIKIDAEGHDYDALVGLGATIERTRPFIIFEMEWADNDKVHGFLAERRYTQLTYDAARDSFAATSTFDPRFGHNAFFVPSELAAKLPGLAS